MSEKKTKIPVEIVAAIIGAIAIVLVAIITPLANRWVDNMPTSIPENSMPAETTNPNSAPQSEHTSSQIISDKRTALEFYEKIYEESGWCALWDYLATEGGVSGECPEPRMEQGSDNPSGETLIDGFVTKEGDYISAFALQADTAVYINYSKLQCVSFDPTNLAVTFGESEKIIEKNLNGWIASDIEIKGPFSLWLRCDGNWQ